MNLISSLAGVGVDWTVVGVNWKFVGVEIRGTFSSFTGSGECFGGI